MASNTKLEYRYSHWRMASLLMAALGFVALGIAIVTGQLYTTPSGGFREFIGVVCILFFGAAAGLIAKQWLGTSGPVLTISDNGVTDIRIAKEEIPWSAVHNLALWHYGRQKSLVLSIDPAVEEQLTLTRTARWTRGPNRSLGVDGLCVTASGLNTSFDRLSQAMTARYQASRAKQASASPAVPPP